MSQFDTPILFLIFNRPDTTAKVFDVIKKVRPKYLYIAADGPRTKKAGEDNLCKQTRDIVLNGIDWPCEVKKNFRPNNLGCGRAVSDAISWFFEHVEEGIILEDDTVPDISFFSFQKEMLCYYRNDEKVMHISGNTFTRKNLTTKSNSYYYSSFPFIWGWGTWRRAWLKYQFDILKMSNSSLRRLWIINAFNNEKICNYWESIFDKVENYDIGYTWDYQWFLSIWRNKGICVLPSVNLVRNIGWNESATHTKELNHHLSKLKIFTIKKPYLHPVSMKIHGSLEWQNFTKFYLPPKPRFSVIEIFDNIFTFFSLRKIKSILRSLFRKIILWASPELLTINNVELLSHKSIVASKISEKSKIYAPYRINNTEIGAFTYIAPNAVINDTRIGKFCSIGPNLCCGYGIHPLHGISTSPMFYSTKKQNGFTLSAIDKIDETKPIFIGNDVFIGINVTILDGVKIGNGAVIAAGAVVISDVPPYAIVGGVPAKIIKYRFDSDTILQLSKTNWYEFEEAQLKMVEKYQFDVGEFLGLQSFEKSF